MGGRVARRAVKKLADAGEVETVMQAMRRYSWERDCWGHKRMLCARLPLSDEDADYWRERAAERAAEANAIMRGLRGW